MFTYIVSPDESIQTISHCRQAMPMGAPFHRHCHTNYELLLVISGDVHYNIDGKQYILKPYDLLFVPASTYHFLIPQSNNTYESYVLNFSQEFIQQERLQMLFAQPRILNILTDPVFHRMFGLFDLYFQTYTQKDFKDASHLLLKEILLYASYKIRTDELSEPVENCHPLILRMTAYITENIREDINSDILAREMNFSKSYVQNIFSSVMGIGLQEYINQKKIHAAHYDIQSGMTPSDVSAKYGYRSYSSFYRQYRKFFGQSPRKIGKLPETKEG